MAKTVKAKERIRLATGAVMTLGEALDDGKLKLRIIENGRYDRDGKWKVVPHYFAQEVGTDNLFDVGKTLYESRSGRKPRF